ncbi:MAG: hypothetical protein SF028_03285 [Candidatus Sumerlaeia bacterium]|nr:hypothetical protein [Candidatus Sumerlaeia bacterium]
MNRHLAVLLVATLGAASPLRAIDPATLPQVGYHPSGIAYWDTPFFADATMNSSAWMTYAPSTWGSGVLSWNQPGFDANQYPRAMVPGMNYRMILYGLHTDYGSRPATWPRRGQAATGKVTLTWSGNADIRLNGGGTFLSAESNGAATGLLDNGRRTYLYTGTAQVNWLEVHGIDAADPITDIDVWLPDPADPANTTLEGQLFHPTFLARLADAPWGFIRFMNWSSTNASPEQDWSDRRLPDAAFMSGTQNTRQPSATAGGYRVTGVAWEYCVALCNEADKDLWLTVPHLATDDYVRKLAQLVRYGSDGVEPYTSTQASPVWAPLEPGRRVYIEYSNEIWSSGGSFPQGDWAQQQATALGITKGRFNGRRFSEVFSTFQDVFGGTDGLVRVAAVFTANDSYNQDFLNEMAAYGPTLSPPAEPDVVAVTTYFGNGIQDWAYLRSLEQAGTADQWFNTTATFDAGGGNMRPVRVDPAHAYWSGADLERHLQATFDEWEYRMLSGDAREGAGPDAVGIGGGFGQGIIDMARTYFPTPKPIIAYEGGPSLYTDGYDGGDSRDDGLTMFMEALNRHPRFETVYRMHLNMAKSKGLRSHSMFTDSGPWGKFGQWGHLEYLSQNPSQAPKYQFLLDWIGEQASLRHIDDVLGAAPSFATPHTLPVAVYGTPYSADIVVTGGDGARTITPIAGSTRGGLALDVLPGDPDRVRIAGTPSEGGRSFAYLRVTDADGDPAWRTFTVRTVGGAETILEANFEGTNPSAQLAWTPTYILASGLAYTGVQRGAGVLTRTSDNSYAWAQNMPAAEVDSTLALAVADNEYLAATITPPAGHTLDLAGKEVRFTIRRLSYHAPRRYAVMTSVAGFAAGAEVFTTDRDGGEEDSEHRFTLPDIPSFEALASPVEFRIYGFAGQYGGHATSLTELRVDGVLAPLSAGVGGAWQAY